MFDFMCQESCVQPGRPIDGATFELMDNIDALLWLHPDAPYRYHLVEPQIGGQIIKHREYESSLPPMDFSKTIPVGSIEFVLRWTKKYHGIQLFPVNIPDELNRAEFLGRIFKTRVFPITREQVFDRSVFLKQMDVFKGFTDVVTPGIHYTVPEGAYMESEVVEFESEWRAFVYKGRLLGLRHYNGDFSQMPDLSTVNRMIGYYQSAAPAYTLDVGIMSEDRSTVLIEAHDLFSCGLYGFYSNDYPRMLAETYRHLTRKTPL